MMFTFHIRRLSFINCYHPTHSDPTFSSLLLSIFLSKMAYYITILESHSAEWFNAKGHTANKEKLITAVAKEITAYRNEHYLWILNFWKEYNIVDGKMDIKICWVKNMMLPQHYVTWYPFCSRKVCLTTSHILSYQAIYSKDSIIVWVERSELLKIKLCIVQWWCITQWWVTIVYLCCDQYIMV